MRWNKLLRCFCVHCFRRHSGHGVAGSLWSRKCGVRHRPSARLRDSWTPACRHFPPVSSRSLQPSGTSSLERRASSRAVPPVAVCPPPSQRERPRPGVPVVRPWWGCRVSVGGLCVPAPGLGGGSVQGSPSAGTAWPRAAGLPGRTPGLGPLLLSEAAVCRVHETGGGVAEGADGDAAALRSAQQGEWWE